MKINVKAWLSAVTFLLLLGSLAFGQETTGSIEGTVVDASKARVPGASVQVTGPAFNRTVTTDNDGFYRIVQVPPGIYTVSVSASNFRPSKIENVQVVLGKSTLADVVLEAGQLQEQVVVSATDVAPIDPTASKIQTNITSEVISLIPKGTNFTSVLEVAPGTRSEPLSGGFQVDGASGSENTFIIDGQEVTNFRTGTLNRNNNLPLQFVQEVQVKSNGFEAEYGGATGGVVNVVTKGSTNEFHGEFGLQFEPSRLFSRPRPVLGASSSSLFYINPQKDSFINTFPSLSLTGPIVKDRVFFTTVYSPQFFHTRRDLLYPTGQSRLYEQDVRWDYALTKIEANITDKLRFWGTYTYNPLRRHGTLDAFESTAPPANNLDLQGGRVPASNVILNGTYTPTSNWVLNLRVGRSYLNEKDFSYGIPHQVRYVCSASSARNGNIGLPGVTPAGQCASGFNSITNNFAILKDISIRKTLDADGSVLFNLGGRHGFKFGYQLNDISNDVEEGYFDTGVIVLLFGRTFSGRGAGPGEIGYGYLQRFGTVGKAGSRNQALYVQDSWQPISRLSLNLGFRIEREDVPSFSQNGVPIIFDWGSKPAPRLGFAYDIFGRGNLKVFASYGWYYDRFKYELPRGSFGGDKYLRDYFVIRASNPNYNFYTRDYALANSYLQLDFRVPSNDPSDNRIDPDLKAARQSEFTSGVEYILGRNFVLSGRYTHKQVDYAIEDVGIFDAIGNELYFIANPGYGVVAKPLLPGVPATPKAERKYDGFEARIERRLARNYFFDASYTYSRLFGNYAGLASSDERGRTSPNVNRNFDLPFIGFTADGKPDNGRLGTDRPHVFKFYGAYTYDWFGRSSNSTQLSASFRAYSGTPVSTRVQLFSAETFLFGRGDLGRTEAFTQTDLYLTHTYRFGNDGRFQLKLDANVLNLFNEANVLELYSLITPANFTNSNFGLPDEASTIQAIFNGGLSSRIVSAINSGAAATTKDARYTQPRTFQGSREFRLGARFIF
jgi:hypothetical protein